MRRRFGRNTLAAAASIAALAALPPVAAGDAVYHTQHMKLEPVGDAPLRSGFVQNIKANGPIIYAHEIYVLNGAAPRATYTVTNHFFVGDSHCADPMKESPFDTAVLTTNRSGNARADPSSRPPTSAASRASTAPAGRSGTQPTRSSTRPAARP
jgi:hypothetical protein